MLWDRGWPQEKRGACFCPWKAGRAGRGRPPHREATFPRAGPRPTPPPPSRPRAAVSLPARHDLINSLSRLPGEDSVY